MMVANELKTIVWRLTSPQLYNFLAALSYDQPESEVVAREELPVVSPAIIIILHYTLRFEAVPAESSRLIDVDVSDVSTDGKN